MCCSQSERGGLHCKRRSPNTWGNGKIAFKIIFPPFTHLKAKNKTVWLRWRTRKSLFQRVGAYMDVRDEGRKILINNLLVKTVWLRWRTRKSLFQRVGAYMDVRDEGRKILINNLLVKTVWLRWRTRKSLFQRVGAYMDVRDEGRKILINNLLVKTVWLRWKTRKRPSATKPNVQGTHVLTVEGFWRNYSPNRAVC